MRIATASNETSLTSKTPTAIKTAFEREPLGTRMRRWNLGIIFVSFSLFAMMLLISWDAIAQKTLDIVVTPNIGHGSQVEAVAISPDGSRVLSGGGDYGVKLWDTSTGRLLRTFDGHRDAVNTVAFSPKDTKILSGGGDALKVWDSETGQLLRTFKGSEFASSATFSADGAFVLSSNGRSLKLWSVATGDLVSAFSSGHRNIVHSVAISFDGKRALSGSADKTAKLWDTATGKVLHSFDRHIGDVHSVAFSNDGSRIVTASYDKTLKVWDANTYELIWTVDAHTAWVISAVFSPDGLHLLSSGRNRFFGRSEIKLWNAATGEALQVFGIDPNDTSSNKWITSLAFSSDGAHFLAGSDRDEVELWSASTGKVIRTFKGPIDSVDAVAFSADGTKIASRGGTMRSDGILRVWDANTGQLQYQGEPGDHSISRDHTRIANKNKSTVQVRELTTGRTLQTWNLSWVDVAMLSPDGMKIITKKLNEPIQLWDVASGKRLAIFPEYKGYMNAIAFSFDGKYLAAADNETTLRLWRTTDAKLVQVFKADSILSAVTFSPDTSQVVSGTLDGTLQVWDSDSGASIRAWKAHVARHAAAGNNAIRSVAFSADGNQLVSASEDKTLRLWNPKTKELVQSFIGHLTGVYAAAFSPVRNRVISGGSDGAIKIWDIETGNSLVTLMATANGQSLAITPEGFFTASARGSDGIFTASAQGIDWVNVVRGFELYSFDQLFQSLYRPDLVRNKLSDNSEAVRRVQVASQKLDLDMVLGSKLPPKITIVSPLTDNTFADARVTVEAKIEAQSGGIGRLEWRVNGVTLGVLRANDPIGGIDNNGKLRRSFVVGEGLNVVELVAYNSKNLIASAPASVLLTVLPPAQKIKPRLHVLTIGVKDYRGPLTRRLNYPVNDAVAIAAAFKAQGANAEMYESVDIHPLHDGDASLQNIREKFAKLSQIVRADDVFVLYMAGHGVTEDGRYYFIPHGVYENNFDRLLMNSIGQDQIQEWMGQITALKSILIYDTCESGWITEDVSGFRGLQQSVAAEKLSRSMGRAFMAATADVADAVEGGKVRHGIFTDVLLEALALGDENDNGRIELSELAKYLKNWVPKRSDDAKLKRQEPQFKITGADFSLVNRFDILEINKIRE